MARIDKYKKMSKYQLELIVDHPMTHGLNPEDKSDRILYERIIKLSEGNSKISKDIFNQYKKAYPEIKKSVLIKKLKKIKKKFGKLDAVTVNYHINRI